MPGALGREVLLILGMHRSGTSLLAGLLCRNGYDPGLDLMRPDATNPTGFYENTAVCQLNERMLWESGSAWDDLTTDITTQAVDLIGRYLPEVCSVIDEQFGMSGDFLIKDPRNCLLLPVWSAAFQKKNIRQKIIIIYRPPFEVAASLNTRDRFPLSKGIHLWSNYLLSAEYLTRGCQRTFISYDDLLANPELLLGSIAHDLGLDRLVDKSLDTSLVDESMRHHEECSDSIGDTIPKPIRELIALVENRDFGNHSSLDHIRESLAAEQRFFVTRETQYTTRHRITHERLETKLENTRKVMKDQQQQLHQRNSEIRKLERQLRQKSKDID